jgi:branched-chain amino acid transport system ATP-binding protein
MTGTVLLDAKGLHKRFGAVVAADDVSIRINAGERVSLIGTNGAGKTTFVNMVTGYLKPDSGQIDFDGKSITGLSPMSITRQGVNRSFQIPQLFLQLTVEENMLAAMASKAATSLADAERSDLAAAQDLMRRFGLLEKADLRAALLPGGLRKLLDIAMVVALKPKLLMLDEPTSGVAASEKYALMDVVTRALGDDGSTVMFIEHDMDIVRRYSDRVVAFAAGKVIADGPPEVALRDQQVRQLVTGEADQ